MLIAKSHREIRLEVLEVLNIEEDLEGEMSIELKNMEVI